MIYIVRLRSGVTLAAAPTWERGSQAVAQFVVLRCMLLAQRERIVSLSIHHAGERYDAPDGCGGYGISEMHHVSVGDHAVPYRTFSVRSACIAICVYHAVGPHAKPPVRMVKILPDFTVTEASYLNFWPGCMIPEIADGTVV